MSLSYDLTFDGQVTSLQPGDRVVVHMNQGTVMFSRNGIPLKNTVGNGAPDDQIQIADPWTMKHPNNGVVALIVSCANLEAEVETLNRERCVYRLVARAAPQSGSHEQ